MLFWFNIVATKHKFYILWNKNVSTLFSHNIHNIMIVIWCPIGNMPLFELMINWYIDS